MIGGIQQPESENVSLRSFFQNTALALQDVNAEVARVDGAMVQSMRAGGKLSEDHKALQALDLIAQSLTELRDLFVRIEVEADPGISIPIEQVSHQIKLEGLRHTIQNGKSPRTEHGAKSAIQLFE